MRRTAARSAALQVVAAGGVQDLAQRAAVPVVKAARRRVARLVAHAVALSRKRHTSMLRKSQEGVEGDSADRFAPVHTFDIDGNSTRAFTKNFDVNLREYFQTTILEDRLGRGV